MAKDKYPAGAIIAAMPFKSGKDAMSKKPGDKGKDDLPVCKISSDDLEKLNNGEQITYSGPDGDMLIEVDDEKGEDPAEEAGETGDEESAEEEK